MFTFMCMNVLPVYMYVHHVNACVCRGQKLLGPWTGITGGWAVVWALAQPDPPEEQVLLSPIVHSIS